MPRLRFLRSLSPPIWAIAASVAAATLIVTVGALILTVETRWPPRFGATTGVTSSLGDGTWDTPWDTVAEPPATPIVEALTDFTETLGWLVMFGGLVCILSLLLHALGWVVSMWNGLVVRSAIGARWRHLFSLLSRRWISTGALGWAVGVAVGLVAASWLALQWPELMTRPPHAFTTTGAGLTAGIVLLLFLTAIAVLVPLYLVRKRRFTSDLQGEHATSARGLLSIQSLLAVLQFTALLVVTFAGFLLWQDTPRVSSGADAYPDLNVATMRMADADSVDTSIRTIALQRLWAEQREHHGDDIALTNRGAWLGLGPLVPVMAFCDACFIGQFFTPVTAETVRVMAVSPGALQAMQGEIVRGRDLTENDRPGAESVVLLNEAAAYRLFPGADSIGRRVHVGGSPSGAEHTVAGVVRRALPSGPGNTVPGVPMIFVSIFQHPPPVIEFAANGALGDLDATDQTRVAGSARMIVESTTPLSEQFRRFEAPLWFFTRLFLIAAIVSVGIACIGLIAVMMETVDARRRELAVRMALGARRRHILNWVVRRALRITGIGIFVGLIGARWIWEVLYTGRSPEGAFFPLLVMTLAFAGVALLASVLPARRAIRLQPAALWSGVRRPSGRLPPRLHP